MTPEEEQRVQEFWQLKPRDASGKRPRPCDVVVTFTDEEAQALARFSAAERRTAGQLKAAQQVAVP